jgi:hypothetical protein
MASREYFVVDCEGYISISPETKGHELEPEAFATLKAATKRATKLAEHEPGRTVVVTRAVAYITCPVLKPKIEVRKL